MRRLSDVSTIGLEEKPVFRPIRSNQSTGKSIKAGKGGDGNGNPPGKPYARGPQKPRYKVS